MAPSLKSTTEICGTSKSTDSSQLSKPKTQHGGHLLKLPSEIRVLIYEQMFPKEKVNLYAINGSLHKAEDAHHIAGEHIAILATCRVVYDEAKPIFYNRTEFCIHTRDEYWLNLWGIEQYVEVFGAEHDLDPPDPDSWNEHNPWLQDPRSIVPVSNIRILTLDMECSTGASPRRWTWTAQLRYTLKCATNITRLHITLKPPYDQERFAQGETDIALEILGQAVRCGGIVTADMSLSLGSMGFNSDGYWRFLAGLRGIDKTYETFESMLNRLKSEHAESLGRLKGSATSIGVAAERYFEFGVEDHNTSRDHGEEFMRKTFNAEIEGSVQDVLSNHYKVREIEHEIEELRRNLDSLKVERKATP